MKNDEISIPNRFENILNNSKFKNYKPLLTLIESDIEKFIALKNKAAIQNGGVIAFVLGETGTGKTTSVYATSIFESELFNNVISVPDTINFREVLSWLNINLPAENNKSNLILFDGREVTDDKIGLSQFITGLNQLLRRRKDILFCWPTVDQEWYKQIYDLAKKIGGRNIAPQNSNINIEGPSKGQWNNIFEKILMQLDIQKTDINITQENIDACINDTDTVGEFLGEIGYLISENTTERRKTSDLPKLTFVISSDSSVKGEANRIRRVGHYVLKAEELLSYSPKSRSGKWWKEKSKNGELSLSYVISLFEARLTTVTPAAVNYACYFCGEDDLKNIVAKAGITLNRQNGKTAVKSTDFYKYLIGENLEELTSSTKGKNKSETIMAYRSIQAKSKKRHKAINQAICKFVGSYLDGFDVSKIQLEVDAGDSNLFTDAIIEINEEMKYFEFHHLSPRNCKASKMSAYIMEKLKYYAIHYNLISM